jgi:hypothetical protein
VLYDFVTTTPVGPVASAEWLTLDENGQITSVYLLFDKARWLEVLDHLNLTAAEDYSHVDLCSGPAVRRR